MSWHISEDRKSKGTTRNADDIVVNTGEHKSVLLLFLETRGLRVVWTDGSGLVEGRRGGIALGGILGGLLAEFGEVGADGDVGELAVVGGTHRVEADEVEGVRVAVVAGDFWDNGGREVRVDHGVEVGAHFAETVGVLVDEGDAVQRIDLELTRELDRASREVAHLRRAGGVGRPFADTARTVGPVLEGEEEDLDGVREAEVDVDNGGAARIDRDIVGHLRLFDEDVARGTGHALALVVGHNGVVGPHLNRIEGRLDVALEIRRARLRDVGFVSPSLSDIPFLDEEFVPVSEGEIDAHFVVRKSRGRKGDARIPRVEEREWKVEVRDRRLLLRVDGLASQVVELGRKEAANVARVGESNRVSNHVVVGNLLSTRDRESRPEVEVDVVKAGGNKIVERNAALLDKIVHKVASPAKSDSRILTRLRLNLLKTDAEPGLKEVITRTRNANRPVLAKLGLTRSVGQHDRNLSEPGRLARSADEISDGVAATIHVLFELVVGREINKARGNVR